MLAFIVPGVAKAVHGKSATACEAQRAAWALSSGSTASRATGITSEEPTAEGTRGEPIGVAILSVARPYTMSELGLGQENGSDRTLVGSGDPSAKACSSRAAIHNRMQRPYG